MSENEKKETLVPTTRVHEAIGAVVSVAIFLVITSYVYDSIMNAYASIADSYLSQGDCENAVDAYSYVKENFAGIEDWFTLALLNLGECYERLEKPDKAIEAYRAIVTLRPDDDFGKTAKRRIKSLEKNN